MARTIQSPGVEIKEFDLSENPSPAIGTYTFTAGFADKGPTDEILQVTSVEEFEQIYGKPTTPAERYFYHSVTQQFNSQANVLVGRLPYGYENGEGFSTAKMYSVLAYPVSGEADNLSESNSYLIQKPTHIELTEQEFLALQDGIAWSDATSTPITGFDNLMNAGIVVVNKIQTTVNDKYEGYYIGIADNDDCEPSSDFASITNVYSVNGGDDYIALPEARMNFTLTASGGTNGNSLSQVMEDTPSFSIFGSEFNDTIVLNVFKLRKSLYADSTIKLDANVSESYVASVYSDREIQSQNGGSPVSFFIEKKAEDSTDIQILVNPYLSGKKGDGKWMNEDGKLLKSIRVDNSTANRADALYALGVYQESKPSTKCLGQIPNKLSRILSKIDNRDLFELDITVEAGLGTIWSYYKAAQAKYRTDNRLGDGDEHDQTVAEACDFNDEDPEIYTLATNDSWFVTGRETLESDLLIEYRNINNVFINFAQNDRKDHMHICDPLRFIFIQGANKKTLSDKSKNFSQHIYWPLRYQFMTANTSYAATYGNWAKVYDAASDDNIWIPMSGVLANTYANTDANFFCWYAPAGPDRGVLTTVSDIAFSPALKQRDQLYKISINPIYQDPNMGFVVFGQKTLQSKPSSFDRVNVRRLFLYLEKSTYNTIKWFLFRNNTYSTRTAIINTLDPIFRSVLNNEGMYDYRIVCNENNNTPDVIDANELVVDIYIKAARTAEFILCNFYSTKTSTNFDELIK